MQKAFKEHKKALKTERGTNKSKDGRESEEEFDIDIEDLGIENGSKNATEPEPENEPENDPEYLPPFIPKPEPSQSLSPNQNLCRCLSTTLN